MHSILCRSHNTCYRARLC